MSLVKLSQGFMSRSHKKTNVSVARHPEKPRHYILHIVASIPLSKLKVGRKRKPDISVARHPEKPRRYILQTMESTSVPKECTISIISYTHFVLLKIKGGKEKKNGHFGCASPGEAATLYSTNNGVDMCSKRIHNFDNILHALCFIQS